MQLTTGLRSDRAIDNEFEPRPGFRPFSPADAESSIAVRFRAAALRHRDSVALVDRSERLTYGELLARATSIANCLPLRAGDAAGTVGVFLPFGAQTVTAILGVLLGGASYFPIEASLPDAQID